MASCVPRVLRRVFLALLRRRVPPRPVLPILMSRGKTAVVTLLLRAFVHFRLVPQWCFASVLRAVPLSLASAMVLCCHNVLRFLPGLVS